MSLPTCSSSAGCRREMPNFSPTRRVSPGWSYERGDSMRVGRRTLLILAALMLSLATATAAQAQTVREWRYVPDPDGERCTVAVREVPLRTPVLGEIRVRMRASSFNGRDRYRIAGQCDDRFFAENSGKYVLRDDWTG